MLGDAVEAIEIQWNYEFVVDMLHYTLVVDVVEVIDIVMPSELGVLAEQIVTTIEPCNYPLLVFLTHVPLQNLLTSAAS